MHTFRAPLPHIATHVEETKSIRREAPHRRGVRKSIAISGNHKRTPVGRARRSLFSGIVASSLGRRPLGPPRKHLGDLFVFRAGRYERVLPLPNSHRATPFVIA